MIALGLLLAGCGVAREQVGKETARLYGTVFQDIADVYIEEAEMTPLVLAGFEGLSSLEPGLAATLSNWRISVSFQGEEIKNFPVFPRDQGGAWGNNVADALKELVSRSDILRNLSPVRRNEAFLGGLFDQLDELSRYNSPAAVRRDQGERDKETASVGIDTRRTEEGLRIVDVPEGSPGQAAGLAEGDFIWSIDGKALAGLQESEAWDLLLGSPGSEADLTVTRHGREDKETVSVTRSLFEAEDVAFRQLDDVLYMRVRTFSWSLARSFGVKIWRARRDLGKSLKGVVLDLRGNGGGFLDSAVEVADLFVTEGLLFTADGRHTKSLQYFEAHRGDRLKGAPIVVLINGETAGSASILAAALQDRGRAVVVGTVTSGHGTIQTILSLPNGGNIALTWALFFAPSGYAIAGRGVLPDLCTVEVGLKLEDIEARLRRGTLPIDRATQQRDIDKNDESATESFRALCPPRDTRPEIDLRVARRLLDDPLLYRLALGPAEGTPDQEVAPESVASKLHTPKHW